MDLDIYPPPDLAIESDVTSKTTLDVYAVLGVPEVWIYSKESLTFRRKKSPDYPWMNYGQDLLVTGSVLLFDIFA
ncbi:MAG: hypothetical protein QNJ70_25385 [Xenococcaceae cyanobacterium MO_207.B15]|nr:hypothetical protein [Xenococcaceae cyanobacterium MO_207.B15]